MNFKFDARHAIACCLLLLVASVFGDSNVDPGSTGNKYGWGENIGWANLKANTTDGVVVTGAILSGYIWAENVGWINVGDGTPDFGAQYTNTGADFGVNNDSSGNLSGYGWGENIGWVNFDTSGSGGSQVTINAGTGKFSGHAWGENVGWISFQTVNTADVAQVAPGAVSSVLDWIQF